MTCIRSGCLALFAVAALACGDGRYPADSVELIQSSCSTYNNTHSKADAPSVASSGSTYAPPSGATPGSSTERPVTGVTQRRTRLPSKVSSHETPRRLSSAL
jgi:hypothetical protein